MKEDANSRDRESCKDSGTGDASGEKSIFSNSLTRRKFLKRTGGATAGTMLALHGMKVEVLAQGGYSAPALSNKEPKKVIIREITRTVRFVDPMTPGKTQQERVDAWIAAGGALEQVAAGNETTKGTETTIQPYIGPVTEDVSKRKETEVLSTNGTGTNVTGTTDGGVDYLSFTYTGKSKTTIEKTFSGNKNGPSHIDKDPDPMPAFP